MRPEIESQREDQDKTSQLQHCKQNWTIGSEWRRDHDAAATATAAAVDGADDADW